VRSAQKHEIRNFGARDLIFQTILSFSFVTNGPIQVKPLSATQSTQKGKRGSNYCCVRYGGAGGERR